MVNHSLRQVAFEYPVIDNHAHQLLEEEARSNFPLEGIMSEANGTALDDAPYAIVFKRGIKQLAKLLDLPSDASWENIKRKRSDMDYAELCRRCFEPTKIQSILIDDGLKAGNAVRSIAWHDKFTLETTRCFRIVRVEAVAEVPFSLFKTRILSKSNGNYRRYYKKSSSHQNGVILTRQNTPSSSGTGSRVIFQT
jgi:hypothetical protein